MNRSIVNVRHFLSRTRGVAALLGLALAAGGLAACGDDPTQPTETRPAGDLNILRRSAAAPQRPSAPPSPSGRSPAPT